MSALLELLGIERPIVQAGMGGGLSRHELAVAVSEAGGLGTIGILDPAELRGEIEAARAATSKPIAVNLLLPFARRGHWDAAARADVVVTFWGRPARMTQRTWIHQCGSMEEAREARAAGADAVIMQGVEAGGHVRGSEPAAALLERAGRELGEMPVLSAGGVADAADVRERLDAGADAVVSGTRFLLTAESGAHPAYKRRLLEADETILTELFGAGWPAPHRVVANAATERWLRSAPRGPGWVRAVNRVTAPALSRLPAGVQMRVAAAQSARLPVLGPVAPTAGGPEGLLDAGPLYAGKSVARINEVRGAAEVVRALTPT